MLDLPCRCWLVVCLGLLSLAHASNATADDVMPQKAEMAGYLLVPHSKVDATYNAGFSMYVAAWSLLESYPDRNSMRELYRRNQHSGRRVTLAPL